MKISSDGFKVYLSTLTTADAESIELNINDPDVVAGINNPNVHYPYKVEDAMQFIGYSMIKYDAGEEFHVAIRLANDNQLVGLCALFNLDRSNNRAEIGYWLGKSHWGKGYAKEALRLLMSFGFGKLELNKIYAKALVGNERSIGLLGSLGFSNEGIEKEEVFRDGKFLDEARLSMLKRDFKNGVNVVVTYE
jgi:[ribosomal protein S5]-alanine N-acetyltransferase